jgi:hypothetical protein
MRNLLICTLTKYYSADQIEKNVLGRARSPYGIEGVAYRGLVGKPGGKRPLGDTDIDGRIILKWIFRKWDEGVAWINLAQDSDRWREHVTAVMNLRVP